MKKTVLSIAVEHSDIMGGSNIAAVIENALAEYVGKKGIETLTVNIAPELPAEKTYASTQWCAEDVMAEAEQNGITLAREKAEEFLFYHEDAIVEGMVATGWSVIRDLLMDVFGKEDDPCLICAKRDLDCEGVRTDADGNCRDFEAV